MKQFLSTIGVIDVLATTCVGCDKIKPPQPQLQQPPAASSQADQQESERKVFTQTAQKELDDLRTAIAEFKAKAETASAQTKAKLSEEVGKLETDLRDTEQRLTELKSATVESWNQIKEAFGSSLGKLKNGIENFRKNAA